MITGLILLWNLFVGILYGMDKAKAKRNAWRIPEKTLLLSAFALGGLGAWTGGLFFHHKTKKWYFKLIWLLGTLLTLYTLYVLWR